MQIPRTLSGIHHFASPIIRSEFYGRPIEL